MSTQAQRGRKVQRKEKQKTLRIFYLALGALVIAGIVFLAIFLTRDNSPVTANPDQIPSIDAPIGVTAEGFYYKGDPEAPVTVIEYSDFQCPACARFDEVLADQIDEQYIETGQVQLIFHDFPLRNAHPHAIKAAEAARSAGEQGQFWPMHDLLYQNQSAWSSSMNPESLFIRYAEQLGLDRDQFAEALRSGRYRGQVEAAEQAALSTGIPATPTFVVNGRQVSAGELVPAIEAALAAEGQE